MAVRSTPFIFRWSRAQPDGKLRQILLAIAKSGAYPFRRGAADAPCWLRLDRNAVSNVGALLDSLAAVARRELRRARSVFFEKTARL